MSDILWLFSAWYFEAMNPELASFSNPASHFALGICYLHLPTAGITGRLPHLTFIWVQVWGIQTWPSHLCIEHCVYHLSSPPVNWSILTCWWHIDQNTTVHWVVLVCWKQSYINTSLYVHLEAEVNNHGYLEILLVGFILKGTLLKVIQDGLQIIQHHLDFLLVSRNIQDLWVL